MRVVPDNAPLSASAWESACSDRATIRPDLLLKAVCHAGLTGDARPHAWPVLLGCWSLSDSQALADSERLRLVRQRYMRLRGLQQKEDMASLYYKDQVRVIDLKDMLLMATPSMAAVPRILKASSLPHCLQGATEEWQSTVRRIGTDSDRLTTQPAFLATGSQSRAVCIARLKRVLAAYALADPVTGYCQGMSDLAAPFLEHADIKTVSLKEEEPPPLSGQDGASLEDDVKVRGVCVCLSPLSDGLN